MPVIAIRDDALPDDAVPAEALGRLVPAAPVVVMIHGYRYSPACPSSDSHRHILALAPDGRHWGAVSWPRRLDLGGGKGLGPARGWEARGSIWEGAPPSAGLGGRAGPRAGAAPRPGAGPAGPPDRPLPRRPGRPFGADPTSARRRAARDPPRRRPVAARGPDRLRCTRGTRSRDHQRRGPREPPLRPPAAARPSAPWQAAGVARDRRSELARPAAGRSGPACRRAPPKAHPRSPAAQVRARPPVSPRPCDPARTASAQVQRRAPRPPAERPRTPGEVEGLGRRLEAGRGHGG